MRYPKKIGFAAILLVGFVGTAMAADLPAPMYTKAPPMPPPLFNWSGFYLGVNVGGSWGRQDVAFGDVDGGFTQSVHPDGVIGGGQIGWNWQGPNSPWVFGLEADIQGSGQRTSISFVTLDDALSLQDQLEWFGTVRGRIGYATGDQGRFMPYITGGLAYGENRITGSGTVDAVPVTFDASNTDIGWTVGAGVEWAFLDQWSVKLEYLFAQFDHGPTLNLPAGTTLSEGHLSDNIVRVGVNWHFR